MFIYKNKNRKKICGVCAGISDFTGIDVSLVRLLWIGSLFFSFGFSIFLYFLLCFLLPSKPLLKIPNDVPIQIQQKIKDLMEKFKLQAKVLKPKITVSLEDTLENLILLARLIQNIPYLNEKWFKLASRLDELLEKKLTHFDLLDIKSLNLKIQENITLINEIRRQNEESIKNILSNSLKEWRDFILPIKMEFLLKTETDKRIKDVFLSLEEKLISLLPYLEDEDIAFDIKYNIKRTGYNYLPETINNYLLLAKDFDVNGQNYNNANTLVLDQLKTLNSALDDIYKEIYEQKSQKMELHGRFLREKFRED